MSRNYYNPNMDCYYENQSCGCSQIPIECPNGNVDDSYVVGNSVDFTVGKCDSEIKADLTVGHRDSVRVWGQIKDCSGNPVPYAYLKLIKINKNSQVGVAHTITDCMGYYQFDICPCDGDTSNYRLLVGKASTGGGERIIASGVSGTNCNPCTSGPQCDCR